MSDNRYDPRRNPYGGYSEEGYYDEETGQFYPYDSGYDDEEWEDWEEPGYAGSAGYSRPGESGRSGYYGDGSYREGPSSGYYGDGRDRVSGRSGYYANGQPPYSGESRPEESQGRMSMAARAAGKTNPDPYARRTSGPEADARARQQAALRQRARRQAEASEARGRAAYSRAAETPRRSTSRRRKKRHPIRNLLIFLLILIGILYALYRLLMPAPQLWEDGVHTRKSGFYNILICATDQEETRTDTMMILSLDQKEKTISLTSLPRDTIVDNGQAVPKLNGVYGLAGGGESGAEALMDQVQTLLGFRPDGYMIINYNVFRDAVDALGGVVFDVPMDMSVDDPETGEIIDLQAGEQRLSGREALAVCRYRYGYAMADIQRQYVQQSFLKAMIRQAMKPESWPRLPGVYASFLSNTVTDLSQGNLFFLGLQGLRARDGDIPQHTLPGEGVSYNGASCYGLFGGSVVDMVNEVMNPFEESITIDDVYILTVSGGSLVESTWRGEAFDAGSYEYN